MIKLLPINHPEKVIHMNKIDPPGNLHDSRIFKELYDKIKGIGIQTLVADAGYKTPAIAKFVA